MRWKIASAILAIAVLLLGIGVYVYTPSPAPETPEENLIEVGIVKQARLTILYDNSLYNMELRAAWGFSCLIELEDKTILFDTGGDAGILLSNMEKLNVDVDEISIIVLSHIHGDHVGGLIGLLNSMKNAEGVTVYVPSSFPESFKSEIRRCGANVVDVKDATVITEGVATTGEMGTGIREQALIVSTERGVTVITGCAHPGVVDMVRRAKELTNRPIHLVIGGFHLIGMSPTKIREIANQLKELGVECVSPCHCSGEKAKIVFREEFGSGYIEGGAGAIIEI